jgi:ABC-type bacteriocin/lantibiotic exporter with double-glycine peptidase domain
MLAAPLPIAAEPAWSSFRSVHIAGSCVPDQEPDHSGHAPAALSIRGISFTYPGSAGLALHDIDINIPPGGLVAVTGPVGSGKSTLGKLAAGIYSPDAGQVLLGESQHRNARSGSAMWRRNRTYSPAPWRKMS